MAIIRHVSLLAAAVVLAVAGPAVSRAEETHSHDGHGAGAAALTLNNGAKWHVDGVVRDSMTEIRNAVQASLPAIHDGKFSAGDYGALAAKVQQQIDNLVANCKLEPAVDEQFHLVLEHMLEGIGLMEGDGDRHDGAVGIVKALGAYAEHFEHPGWQPLIL